MAAGHADIEQETGFCRECGEEYEIISTENGFFVEPHLDGVGGYCDGGLLPPRSQKTTA